MAPRKFSGPIQQGAIRVLRDLEVASTSDIMPITHPRQLNPQHRSKSLRRVLDEIAIRVGRAGGQGTPVLWRLKPEFRSLAAKEAAKAEPKLLTGSEPAPAPGT